MDPNLDALTRELTALTQRFVDLGAKLGDAARALEELGAPPSDGLVDDLAGARGQFIQLRTDVLSAAVAASVPPSGPPESLTELEPLLVAIEAALRRQAQRAAFEETRTRAIATLDRVLEIAHRDDPSFPALAAFHGRARAVREAALALTDPETPEARRLEADVQSFGDVLMMVESRDALDDERYAQLEEGVSRTFGRTLAVAVARGKLCFEGQQDVPPPLAIAFEPTTEMPPLELETRDAVLPEPEPEPRLEAEPEPVAAAPEPEPLLPESEPEEVLAAAQPAPAAPEIEPASPPLEIEPAPAAPDIEPASAALVLEPASAAPEPERAPVAPEPEPVATVVEPAAAAPEPEAEPAGPDETAQWWLAAWARWSGWKATHDFASVVREEVGKYPYLLSVPIQRSPEYDEGLLAYGYSILMDHVEKQSPGCVGNALNSLKPGEHRPVGDQLYEYLVAEGRLEATYPEFVKNVTLASVPDPGLWFQFRILESKEDTRILQRPSGRVGDPELAGQRLANDSQRYAEHKFKMTLPPLTTRYVQVSADNIRDARGVGVKIARDGAPSDSGWIVCVPAGAKGKLDARRVAEEGTHVAGVGKEFATLWIAVFNADPAADRRYELSVVLRKDARSPFRGRA